MRNAEATEESSLPEDLRLAAPRPEQAERAEQAERVASRPLVLLASPRAERRAAWRRALETAFLVEEASSRESLVWQLALSKPRLVLLEDGLRGVRGPQDLARLGGLAPETKLVVCARRIDTDRSIAALRAGAKGYCSAEMPPGMLPRLVSCVLAGEIWVGRRIVSSLLEELFGTGNGQARYHAESATSTPAPASEGLGDLSLREIDVARLLSRGFSNKEIATELQLSEKTVKAHLTAVFAKLGVSSRLQLGVFLTTSRAS